MIDNRLPYPSTTMGAKDYVLHDCDRTVGRKFYHGRGLLSTFNVL
jgi:hypothetical protein